MRSILFIALLAACDEAADVCVYEGTEYSFGSRFPAGDGCNTCECLESFDGDPVVSCTEMACAAAG